MDDFTQGRKLKMGEENLWLVHGREDVSYKESWAQRRLLEKKNARKRKQEEASAALKNIDLQSNAKRSPVKSRYPLTPKNENDIVGARLPPVAKPRTDGADKKSSPTKRRHNNGKSPGKDLEEILDSGRKSQIFTNSKHSPNEVRSAGPKSVSSESESVQEKVARLQNRGSSREEDINVRHRQGSLSRSNSNDTPTTKADRSSGSISNRLAMFESTSKSSASPGHLSKASDQKHKQKTRKPSEDESKHFKDEEGSHRLSAKLKKTSTMRDNTGKNEVYSPLSPKLASISAVEESSLDYQSDENPFDISSILRAANEEQSHTPEAAEYTKASWNVLDYLTEASPKMDVSTKVRQRDSVYSNCGDEESLSGFGKEIAKKRNALKGSSQQEHLKKLDSNVKERAMHSVKKDQIEMKGKEEKRVKQAAPKRESSHVKQERKEEKRKAPRYPGDDNAGANQNEMRKKRRPESTSDDAAKQENRQAPPKPPRKGKLSVEEVTDGVPVEISNAKDVTKNVVDIPLEWNEQMEVMMEDERKKASEKMMELGIVDCEKIISTKMSSDGLEKKDGHGMQSEEKIAKKMKQNRKLALEPEVEKHSLPDINEKPINDAANELIFSPNSKSYQSVREKKTTKSSRKGMRRSMSFSEGQSPIVPVIHKSGYNEEASSMYNVVTNCGTPVRDEEKSTSDKVKELLDYAVSQQNIVIQASQALNLSLNGEEKKGCPEIIEGERLLLLATQRRTACLDEVERLKQTDGRICTVKDSSCCPPCKANIVISEINLPLNGDFLVALRGGRMDLGVFHFVVLIQHGPTQIYSTKVRCTYDELSRNYLTFKDKITLKDISHDFALTVKVFGMHTKRASDVIHRGKKGSQSKESPGLMKNVFSSLTPKRRMNSADDSPVRGSSPKPVFRTTNFTAVGNADINLSNCGAGKFVLNQVPKNCPLDGFIDLKIDCLPEFTASARGFLTLLEEVGGYTAWNRRWCVMQGDLISFWRFPDEEDQKPPTDTIDLRMCSNKLVDVVPRMECSRPNTFELMVKRPLSKHDTPSLLSTIEGKEIYTKHWLSADNKEDRMAWILVLNRQLSDSKAWSVKHFKNKMVASDSPRKKQRGAVAV